MEVYPKCFLDLPDMLKIMRRKGISFEIPGEERDCQVYFLWKKKEHSVESIKDNSKASFKNEYKKEEIKRDLENVDESTETPKIEGNRFQELSTKSVKIGTKDQGTIIKRNKLEVPKENGNKPVTDNMTLILMKFENSQANNNPKVNLNPKLRYADNITENTMKAEKIVTIQEEPRAMEFEQKEQFTALNIDKGKLIDFTNNKSDEIPVDQSEEGTFNVYLEASEASSFNPTDQGAVAKKNRFGEGFTPQKTDNGLKLVEPDRNIVKKLVDQTETIKDTVKIMEKIQTKENVVNKESSQRNFRDGAIGGVLGGVIGGLLGLYRSFV